jgi:hypothetical protein
MGTQSPDTGGFEMAKPTDVINRVVPLPEGRQSMQKARDAGGLTNAAFMAGAVTDHLARPVESLQALGFARLQGKRRPARLPFSIEAGTLQALREASNHLVQVPATTLLLLCLAAAITDQPAKPKRRGRRKAEPSGAE